jgi:hypothetical protein
MNSSWSLGIVRPQGQFINRVKVHVGVSHNAVVEFMNYELTGHAKESLQNRGNIHLEWLEQAIVSPHRIDPNLEHRLLRIDEFDGRVLRVVMNANVIPQRILPYFSIAV